MRKHPETPGRDKSRAPSSVIPAEAGIQGSRGGAPIKGMIHHDSYGTPCDAPEGGLLLHLRTTGGTGEAELARVSRNPRPSRQRSFAPLHASCGDRVTDRPLSRSRQEASRTSSWIGPRRSLRQRKGATHPRGPSKQRVRSRSLESFLEQFLDLRCEGRESLLPVADDPESRLSEDVGLGVLVDGDDGL